jgi:hypothetical protein
MARGGHTGAERFHRVPDEGADLHPLVRTVAEGPKCCSDAQDA